MTRAMAAPGRGGASRALFLVVALLSMRCPSLAAGHPADTTVPCAFKSNCTLVAAGGNTTIGWCCKNHHCIAHGGVCNGVNDCGDNSDEKVCSTKSDVTGYVAAMTAAAFFGSNFLPIKRFETGDGFFFQFILVCGIWTCGAVTQLATGAAVFQPAAFLGGMSWATGNLVTVPSIQAIGMAQAILVWGTVNMTIGWASGRFGLFGIVEEVPAKPMLQYLAVVASIVSVLLFALIKTTVTATIDDKDSQGKETDPLLGINSDKESGQDEEGLSWVQKLSPVNRRIAGILLASCGGVMFGLTFDPSQSHMDNTLGASQDALHYVFSQFSGIFFTGTVWFMVYCMVKRNRPVIYPRLILPAYLSGLMWGIAQTSWFVANQHLSQAAAYPIVCTMPGIIATLWGVLLFGEIRGARNFVILLLAYGFTIGGVALNVMSQ